MLAVLFQLNQALGQTCRDAVVGAYESLGASVDPNSFSSAKFEDFNLSVEEFNDLSSDEQEVIYIQVRPMKITVQSTVNLLNSRIARYAGTFYEMYVIDKLERWRKSVDDLKSCDYEN